MANEELRVPIGIPVDTNASTAADSIQALRDSVTKSKDSIKEAAAAMRDLRGKSDDVKAAKDQLVAKIRAEEAAVTKATLAIIKQGAGHEATAKKAKDGAAAAKKATDGAKSSSDVMSKAVGATKKATDSAKAGSDAMSKAIGAAGGPVASLKDKLGGLNDLLGGSEGGMAAVAGIAALAAAAIVAVGVAAIGAAAALAKFIIVSADAARMMQLTRKANLNGNEQWAKNLGDQVDALARSIPIAKDKLNELGISLAKSRIGGQTMVDTMKAVGGATAAAGDDLGNKLKGIVERGAFTRRFTLAPQELLGMDLDFDEVAKAYATGMHVSVERARQELVSGRVKLADGAAALKKAVEDKFGAINADKLLGLDNQLTKFKQDLAGMAKDVNLTPLLKGIKSLADNFDQTNTNGVAMKHIVETIGRSLGVTFTEGVPILQGFIDKAVWGALRIENYWLRAKIAFRETFGGKTTLEGVVLKSVLNLIPAFGLLTDGVEVFSGAWTKLFAINWESVGSNIVNGIKSGLESGALGLVNKVKGLADDIKKAFTKTLHIESPSKDFYQYGKQTSKGAELGIDAGAPAVHEAAAEMAPTPGAGARGGALGGGGRGATTLTFSPTIIVQGGVGADVRAQLKDPSLLQALTEAFLGQIRAAGIEVPA